MKKVKILFLSLLLLMLFSCRVQETTSVDNRSASTSVSRVLADSVIVRDSIIIREIADTVYFTKYRTLYKERLRCDTVVRCDTVYVTRTVKEKGRSPSVSLWWLLVPLVALLWKTGALKYIRKMIIRI